MFEGLKKLTPWRRRELAVATGGERTAPEATGVSPAFAVITHEGQAAAVFQRLRDGLRRRYLNQGRRSQRGSRFTLEYGALPHGRQYIFVAPWSEAGWLFEGSGTGWLLSRAEKIVARDTFVRSALAVDQVTLYQRQDQPGGCLRLESTLFGPDLMTFPLYERELHQFLGWEP